MKIILICSVLVLTTITAAIGAPHRRVVTAGFIDGIDMVPFSIVAIMNPYNPKTYPNIHTGKYIGTDDGVPKYVCSGFTVSIGGKNFRIPSKAYSDLEDIQMITRAEDVVGGGDELWSIKIVGGSGAGFYELEFILDSERLLERRFVVSEPEKLLGPNIPKDARWNHFNEMISTVEKY